MNTTHDDMPQDRPDERSGPTGSGAMTPAQNVATEPAGSDRALLLPANGIATDSTGNNANALTSSEQAWAVVVEKTLATTLQQPDEPTTTFWKAEFAAWAAIVTSDPTLLPLADRAFRTLVAHLAYHRPAWCLGSENEPIIEKKLNSNVYFQMGVGLRQTSVGLDDGTRPSIHDAFIRGVLNSGEPALLVLSSFPGPDLAPTPGDGPAVGQQATTEAQRLAHQAVERVIADDETLDAAMIWFGNRLKELPDERVLPAVDALRRTLAERVPKLSIVAPTRGFGQHRPKFPGADEKRQLTTEVKRDIVRLLRDNDPNMPEPRRDAMVDGLIEPIVRDVRAAIKKQDERETSSSSPRLEVEHETSSYFPRLEVEQQRFKPCGITLGEFNDSDRFKVLTENTPLRTVGMDPWAWQDAMDRAFPWMRHLTARLVRRLSIQLAERLPLQLPTIALLGDSGVGKTLYWVEAMRLLDHPFIVQGMAGMNDSVAIKGTAAGWTNARPGLAATAMATLTCGNPVILLDELDKAAGGEQNGRSMDALLPMLEHATARQYRDDCLQQAIDTSHLSWVVTLNDEDRLSPTLRSRLEVVEVPGPDWTSPEHVDAALTLGEQLAWDAWPAKLRTDTTQLSASQKDRLRQTRWKSLRSLGQAIRAQVEENLYRESVDQVLAQRPAGTPSASWRPTTLTQA